MCRQIASNEPNSLTQGQNSVRYVSFGKNRAQAARSEVFEAQVVYEFCSGSVRIGLGFGLI
jgi:hypothetical protein